MSWNRNRRKHCSSCRLEEINFINEKEITYEKICKTDHSPWAGGGIMLTGCQKNESGSAEPTATPEPTEAAEEVTPEPTAMAAEEPEPTEDPIPDGYVVSYLTGEYVPEAIGRRRPVAVMLNNLRPACPQAGIANAGVVYEAPVEGGITRLMGVFEDYDNLEKIGSVRSCRDYYIFYASGLMRSIRIMDSLLMPFLSWNYRR